MSFNGKIQIKVDRMTKLKTDAVKGVNWDDARMRRGGGVGVNQRTDLKIDQS